MIILNIGMMWNDQQRIWYPSEIRHAMEHEGWTILHLEVRKSPTEPTVVAVIKDDNFTRLHAQRLCHILHQDCFAAFKIINMVQDSANGTGHLYGPKADDWGQFDMKRFIMPNPVALRRAYMQSTEEYYNAQRTAH